MQIGPPPADEPPVPAQLRCGRDEPVPPQRPGSSRASAASMPGPPSPASVSGPAVAAPAPRGGAPAARRPWRLPSVRAASSTRSCGRRSTRTAVPPQAAILPATHLSLQANPQVSHLCPFGTPQAGTASRSRLVVARREVWSASIWRIERMRSAACMLSRRFCLLSCWGRWSRLSLAGSGSRPLPC